jgi:hypothetical protein
MFLSEHNWRELAMKKNIALLVTAALLAPLGVALTSGPAFASAPTVTSIVKTGTTVPSGSVSGSYDVEIDGTGFCTAGNSIVSNAAIGDIVLTSLAVNCGAGTISATVPAQTLANREVGAFPVVVTTSGGSSTSAIFFSLIPQVDSTYAAIQQTAVIQLGELFSRTQRQPIVRSRTAPYTVSGIDSLTGQPYTYVTNYDYLAGLDCDASSPNFDEEDCGAYSHEPDLGEPTHMGSLDPVVLDNGDPTTDLVVRTDISAGNLGNGYLADLASDSEDVLTANGPQDPATWLGSRTVVELYSDLDCGPGTGTDDRTHLSDTSPSGIENYFDSGDGDGPKVSYCAGFGPDLYSEPFVATAGKSLAFEWAAIGDSDDYAVYAFLVKVDPSTGAIPANATTSNHKLAMYASGSQDGTSDWNTSTADVTENGTYRFRFINGSYDGTGGFKLGSLFYISELFLTGDTNEIDFGPFDDRIVQPNETFVITASSTAGGAVTVGTLSPNVCTVAPLDMNATPPTYTVTVVSTDSTCLLQSSQGSTGSFAPASTVLGAIEFRSAASVPGAPTLITVTSGDTELTIDWNAGPTGGTAITNYEYSIDNGATWVTVSPSSVLTDRVITGLTNGTSYSIMVRAVNAQGFGPASNMLIGIPGGQNQGVGAGAYDGPILGSFSDRTLDPCTPKSITITGTKLSGAKGSIQGKAVTILENTDTKLVIATPAGLTPARGVDLVITSPYGTLTHQNAFDIPAGVCSQTLSKGRWTQIQSDGKTVKMYAKDPIGDGKVQFFVDGKELAWITAVDATDPKLSFASSFPYLVRSVDLKPGKNRFEIRVDGKRVWRTTYVPRS